MPKPNWKTCPHPKDKEVEMGLAIFCGVCNTRLRFLSDEDANEKIIEGIKNFFM